MAGMAFPRALATEADLQALRPDLTLDARVALIITREILAGHHPPGCFIREVELAERLGVSRPRVREALRNVFRAGFVRVEPWRGAQVVTLSARDTRYLLDLMEANFSVVAALASENFPEELFGRLETQLARLEKAVANGALELRVAASFDLARLLSQHCGSLVAQDLLSSVGSLVRWQHRFLRSEDPEAAKRSYAMMEALVLAVKAREADVARQCALSVIRITRNALLAAMPPD